MAAVAAAYYDYHYDCCTVVRRDHHFRARRGSAEVSSSCLVAPNTQCARRVLHFERGATTAINEHISSCGCGC